MEDLQPPQRELKARERILNSLTEYVRYTYFYNVYVSGSQPGLRGTCRYIQNFNWSKIFKRKNIIKCLTNGYVSFLLSVTGYASRERLVTAGLRNEAQSFMTLFCNLKKNK